MDVKIHLQIVDGGGDVVMWWCGGGVEIFLASGYIRVCKEYVLSIAFGYPFDFQKYNKRGGTHVQHVFMLLRSSTCKRRRNEEKKKPATCSWKT